jgi:hypothetical protein
MKGLAALNRLTGLSVELGCSKKFWTNVEKNKLIWFAQIAKREWIFGPTRASSVRRGLFLVLKQLFLATNRLNYAAHSKLLKKLQL